MKSQRGRWGFVLVLVLVAVLVLGCHSEDRALVLEGLRAGERCAAAVFDAGLRDASVLDAGGSP